MDIRLNQHASRSLVAVSLGLTLWCCQEPAQSPPPQGGDAAAATPAPAIESPKADAPAVGADTRMTSLPAQFKVDHPLSASCEARTLTDCVKLASMLLLGRDLPVSLEHAEAYYKFACDQGHAPGCHGWALVLRDVVKTPAAQVKALELLKDNCAKLDYAPSCASFAQMRANGEGAHADRVEALAVSRKGCQEDKLPHACQVAARLLMAQGPQAAEADLKEAAPMLQIACEGGLMESCEQLGTLYERGRGALTKDLVKARALYAQACEGALAAEGCTSLARMLRAGAGGARDLEGAYALDVKACALDKRLSCAAQVSALLTGQGVAQDEAQAISLLEQLCARKDNLSCRRLERLKRAPDAAKHQH